MSDNFDKKLGETLRRIREEKRVSAQTMADRLGVTKQALSYWERGDRGMKASTLRDYCAALGGVYANRTIIAGRRFLIVRTIKKPPGDDGPGGSIYAGGGIVPTFG